MSDSNVTRKMDRAHRAAGEALKRAGELASEIMTTPGYTYTLADSETIRATRITLADAATILAKLDAWKGRGLRKAEPKESAE